MPVPVQIVPRERVYRPEPEEPAPPPKPDLSKLPPTKRIIAETAEKHGLTVKEMMSRPRGKGGRQLARVRQEAAYRLHEEAGRSYPQIARALGYRDHTTPIAGVRAYERRMREEG